MKYRCLFFLLLCAGYSFAQGVRNVRSKEAGIMFGAINYSGDVPEKLVEINQAHFGYGVFYRYQLSPKFALKNHFYSGSISGDDRNNSRIASRKFRFSTSLLELGLVAEWHILGKERLSRTGMDAHQLTPYIYGGVAATFANATASCYGTPEEIARFTKIPFPEPGIKSRLLTVPIGVGLRYDLTERLTLGSDLGYRIVFSDDLDGISINGNAEHNDFYYIVGLTVSYLLTDPYHFTQR